MIFWRKNIFFIYVNKKKIRNPTLHEMRCWAELEFKKKPTRTVFYYRSLENNFSDGKRYTNTHRTNFDDFNVLLFHNNIETDFFGRLNERNKKQIFSFFFLFDCVKFRQYIVPLLIFSIDHARILHFFKKKKTIYIRLTQQTRKIITNYIYVHELLKSSITYLFTECECTSVLKREFRTRIDKKKTRIFLCNLTVVKGIYDFFII